MVLLLGKIDEIMVEHNLCGNTTQIIHVRKFSEFYHWPNNCLLHDEQVTLARKNISSLIKFYV